MEVHWLGMILFNMSDTDAELDLELDIQWASIHSLMARGMGCFIQACQQCVRQRPRVFGPVFKPRDYRNSGSTWQSTRFQSLPPSKPQRCKPLLHLSTFRRLALSCWSRTNNGPLAVLDHSKRFPCQGRTLRTRINGSRSVGRS